MTRQRGRILIFAGPSGAGKGTVEKAIMERFDAIQFSVSVTTRPRRNYEVEGKHYFFIDEATFRAKIANDELIEWEQVFTNGYLYGTLRSYVDEAMEEGKLLLLDIDIKGGLNVQRQYPQESISIFIQPPSVEELERRLIARGTDSPEQIRIRMDRMPEEMELSREFDYRIINDNLDKAVEEVSQILVEQVFKNEGVHTWD